MNIKKALLIIEPTIALRQLFVKIRAISLVDFLPETITLVLMTSIGVKSVEFPQICWLFIVNSFLLRLIWNLAIVIHGLGHTLFMAILDQDTAVITIANILENRTVSQISTSLIPLSSIFMPGIRNNVSPWLTSGKSDPYRLRLKALGGPLFNLVFVVLCPWSSFQEHTQTNPGFAQFALFVLVAFIGAHLLILLTSWSDLITAVTGQGVYLYCGNFGFIGQRHSNEGLALLPGKVINFFKLMGQETEIRGEQAGGGLTLACDRKGQIVFVGKKLVNRKRGHLTRSLESAFSKTRFRAILAGLRPVKTTTMGVWHYRYGTSSPPSELETHWHEWVPARTAMVWEIQRGQWVRSSKNLNHRITHNGDFDAWNLFGQSIDNQTLGLWLERVLHSPNYTLGDSPKIAGMMDLLITQGMWDASVLLSYQLVIASALTDAFGGRSPEKQAPNTAPTEFELRNWSDLFETEFERQIVTLPEALSIFAPEYLEDFEQAVVQKLNQNPQLAHWPDQQLILFARTAIQAFLRNDLYRATQILISRAQGSFGLVTVSTLEPEHLVLSALGQPMTIGYNRQEQYMVYASEPTAVDAVLFAQPETYRLDLNPNTGEVVLLSASALSIYSLTAKRELTPKELEQRWTTLQDHPYILPSTEPASDLVKRDLNDIPKVLEQIQDLWLNPASPNRQSAEHLLNLLIVKAERLIYKQEKLRLLGLSANLDESGHLDILITGIENSLCVGERFAQDLKTVFPLLSIQALSANQVLQRLQYDLPSLRLTKQSIVFAISQSGQTFSTLQVLNACDLLVRQGLIQELFILTGEPTSFIGSPLSQSLRSPERVSRRIFINGCGRRTAEPATVSVAATHQTLTELLFYLSKNLQSAFPNGQPLGLSCSPESLLVLERMKDEFLSYTVPEITGMSHKGTRHPSRLHRRLIERGRQWALHITEAPLAWGIHALYVLITVGWAIPFGYSIPLLQTIFKAVLVWLEIPLDTFIIKLIASEIMVADLAIYIFGPWLWALGLRWLQGRQLLARTGKRTLVIGDLPWVHQLLQSYVSKLFSLSYGITSLEVHGANPGDHLLHHFGHRVVRGALIFLGFPDGRFSQKQQSCEQAVLMTGKQANGIHHLGVGPEIVALGSNPAIGRQGFTEAIVLPGLSYLDSNKVIEELREGRFGSFERLLASYVFFWALAERVATFPLLRYTHWKSQSRTKIMTTAAPVAADNLNLPEDEEVAMLALEIGGENKFI